VGNIKLAADVETKAKSGAHACDGQI